MSTESAQTTVIHALLQISLTRNHVLVVTTLALVINLEELAVKRAHGDVPNHCGWLGWVQFTKTVCLLRSFTVSSCSCCIKPSVTMQGDPL